MKKIITITIILSLLFTSFINMEIYGNESNIDKGLKQDAKAVILMEASSGKIVYKDNECERLCPASVTKIMTLLLIFDAIRDKKITLKDMATTSAHGKSMGGSQVFLEEGEKQSVETLIKCIVIASGNDASVTMAEFIAGSEEAFVKMMNEKAKKLGMEDTHFEDCCGLTDSDNHYTSAKDIAIMSRELITNYPEIFKYSTIWMETIIHKTDKGEKEFVLTNTNKLLKTNKNVLGLKTGSTSKAKYCVSIVARKKGMELIAVVMAAPDYKKRFQIGESLLNYGFSNCKLYKDKAKHKFQIMIQGGRKSKVKCESEKFSYVTTTGFEEKDIKLKKHINKKICAPISKGETVGKIVYYLKNKKIGECNIVSKESIKKMNYKYAITKLLKITFGIN